MDPFEMYLKTAIDCCRESIEDQEKTIEELTNQVDELNKIFDPLDLKGTKYKAEIIEKRMWILVGANTEKQGLLRNLESLERYYKMAKEEAVEE